MRFTFRFRLVPLIATVLVCALGVTLAQWQTRRAAEKIAIEQTMAARQSAPPLRLNGSQPDTNDIEYRRVTVEGEFVSGWPIYLENRPHNGVAGFYLLMPLKIDGSTSSVLVQRGWLPRDPANRTRLPQLVTPAGKISLTGIVRSHPGRLMQLGQAASIQPGAIVQNLDIPALAEASKLQFQPFLIEQTSDTADGMVRDWPLPSSGVDKHRGYAFQWYALAAMALLFFVVTGFRRGPN